LGLLRWRGLLPGFFSSESDAVGFDLLLPPGFSLSFSAAQAGGRLPAVLAFPCFVIGLLASPLCGAALTFFAAAKKVSKESGLTPLACRCPSLSSNRKRPKTRPALAPLTSVTKHSSAPASRCAPRRRAHPPPHAKVDFALLPRMLEAAVLLPTPSDIQKAVTGRRNQPATRQSAGMVHVPITQQARAIVHTLRAEQTTKSYAQPARTECVDGMNEPFVTNEVNARGGLVFGPLRGVLRGGHLQAGGVSPLSLLTFFAAAKKVSAAPHRGEANGPKAKQGKTNAVGKKPNPQSGVAIISALLVVALSAILVSGILWRQQVQIRRIENQRLLSQAQWISRGALDWTRLILRSEGDTSAGITYLGGVWGVPIAKTRLSDFLGQIGEVRASEGAATYLSGSIEDAESKFNLRNLVSSPAPGLLQLNVEQIAAFQRLLAELGVNGQLAQSTAVQVRKGLGYSATRFQSQTTTVGGSPTPVGGASGGTTFTNKPGIEDDDDDNNNAGVAPLQMTSVDSLLDVPGFTPDMIARLRPFVTYLPTNTAVNMNTAPAEVVAAVVPGMTLSNAQAFVARRETVFFHNVGDVQLALQGAGVTQLAIDPSLFDVTTSYFFIHGRVDHERAEVDRTTLVYRDPLTHTTRIVRVQDQL
jgi:general secretion pathway protein K